VKKLLIATVAFTALFSSVAFAAEPIPPRNNYTVHEINKALEFFGKPSLGSSRILHNDRDGTRDKETTKTFTESTITYHSGNK
jgi:hypothetical protein